MSAPEPESLYASDLVRWPQGMSNLEEKQAVADHAAERVESGQIIGIGSGSTTYLVLWAIGQRVQREGLSISVTTSSYETATAARTLGLQVIPLGSVEPDWGVDGADEVDPHNRLIKGRGGAMYREKILWSTAKSMYLAVDPSKHVQRLGEKFPVPIEVDPMAVPLLARFLAAHDARDYRVRLDDGMDRAVRTESRNVIIDASFDDIPFGLHAELKGIPGVVETGLFEGFAFEIL
jgi:ribose 5-phosphate isomerase A